MAGRPPKKGIDYAGWSVDIFDNDTTMDKLLDAQGWDGFGIFFYLCQRAYGGEGYFYKWGYDDCASTARKMGGGIGSGTVKEAVDYCLQIGLFDKRLFDGWGVLTSRGIQKRYCTAIKDRDVKEVIAEYWLLHSNEECKGLIKSPINMYLSKENTNFPAGNDCFEQGNNNFDEQKESKGKESKGNITVSKDTVRQTQSVQRAVEEWNLLSDIGIKSISKLSNDSTRYKMLTARMKQYGIDNVVDAMHKIRDSSFLQGKNKTGWMITFDWFVRPNNFPKVFDENYSDRQSNYSSSENKYSAIAEFLEGE